MGRLALLLLVATSIAGCDLAPPRRVAVREPVPFPVELALPDTQPAPPRTEHVVLVTIDGVRPEDAVGPSSLMPRLVRLAEGGVALAGAEGCANPVRASGPNFVSMPGYVEIFTGAPSTGCQTNECAAVTKDTFVDDVRASGTGPGDVAVFASWDRYANAVTRHRSSILLSAGGREPNSAKPAGAHSGAAKDDPQLRTLLGAGASSIGYPGWGNYRPDAHTGRVALRYLETVMPRLLVVGLGDPDEHAHRGDFAGYRKAVTNADAFLGDLAATLERMGTDGTRTTVLVTTDHGRGHGRHLAVHGAAVPESQHVFVAAFGLGVRPRGVACPAAPLTLSHVAGAVRGLLGLAGGGGPLAAELARAD